VPEYLRRGSCRRPSRRRGRACPRRSSCRPTAHSPVASRRRCRGSRCREAVFTPSSRRLVTVMQRTSFIWSSVGLGDSVEASGMGLRRIWRALDTPRSVYKGRERRNQVWGSQPMIVASHNSGGGWPRRDCRGWRDRAYCGATLSGPGQRSHRSFRNHIMRASCIASWPRSWQDSAQARRSSTSAQALPSHGGNRPTAEGMASARAGAEWQGAPSRPVFDRA